jgi:hypothetical protein
MLGTTGTYTILLLVVLGSTPFTKEGNEVIMWLPIIVLFGLFYMAPLIAMSWIGCELVSRVVPPKPEQGGGFDGERLSS